MISKTEYIKSKMEEHLNLLKEKNYDVAYLALQGSQNYNLDLYTDTYCSDVDTKAIIVPSIDDVICNKQPVSTTLILPDNSHCDVKDIRIMFDTFRKQNINFMEILFTKWNYINPAYKTDIDLLLQYREQIARLNYNQALRCMVGMSLEKMHALEHPYPTCAEEINTIGYSRKQLSHIIRINDFIKQYTAGVPYEKCLIPNNLDYVLEMKTAVLPLEEARRIARLCDAETFDIKEKHSKENDVISQGMLDLLDIVKCGIIKKKFKNELLLNEEN